MFGLLNQNSYASQRAFVAGATGATGRRLVEALVANGVETIAHIRPDSHQLDEWVETFHVIGAQVDLTAWEQVDISSTLARLRPTLVFCLLGSSPERTRKRGRRTPNPFVDSYEAVDYGLTAMLVRASASSGSRPRFVLLSAFGAQPKSRSAFHRAKGKAEDFLRNSGVPYLIVQTPPIKAPGRKGSSREGKNIPLRDLLLTLGKVAGAKRLQRRHHSIRPDLLAKSLVEAALDPERGNNLLFPEDIRY